MDGPAADKEVIPFPEEESVLSAFLKDLGKKADDYADHMFEEDEAIDHSEVRRLVQGGHDEAKRILTERIDDLHSLAGALIEFETGYWPMVSSNYNRQDIFLTASLQNHTLPSSLEPPCSVAVLGKSCSNVWPDRTPLPCSMHFTLFLNQEMPDSSLSLKQLISGSIPPICPNVRMIICGGKHSLFWQEQIRWKYHL